MPSSAVAPPRVGDPHAPARRVMTALLAGIIAAIAVDVLPTLPSFPASYQFIASGVVGARAFTAVRYAYMGIALHFAISIFWTLLYALVAGQAGRLARWIVGGVVFGAVVWAGMQGVLVFAHLSHGPGTVGAAALGLAEHIAFFGLPAAFVLRRA